MSATPRRALILDLDFTLLHLEAVDGAIEVPGRTRSAYLAPRTVEILQLLQGKFDIVLATARSYDGTKWVVDGLRQRDVIVVGLVLEDGARLGRPNELRPFKPDFGVEEWRARLLDSRNGPGFEWQYDFENCLVARCETAQTGEILLHEWRHQHSASSATARFFRDGRKVYALPKSADKWSALQTLLGARASQAAGVGDGENDLVWLPRVASPTTFGGANSGLIQAVRAKNGLVCDLDGHAGIAQILGRWL